MSPSTTALQNFSSSSLKPSKYDCAVLVQVSVMAEQHARVEKVVVDCEDLGHDVESVQAERMGVGLLAENSFEDGEGSLGELVDVDAGGYAVVQRAGLDDDGVVSQAMIDLAEVLGIMRAMRGTSALDHKIRGQRAAIARLLSSGCWVWFGFQGWCLRVQLVQVCRLRCQSIRSTGRSRFGSWRTQHTHCA
jgi:hypothetical protein